MRVEAFIYSLELEGRGPYLHSFHVTDWFPTILDIAGATYKPEIGYHLDGVSQFQAVINGGDPPREYMLLNYYYDPYDPTKNLWTGKAAAIRNSRYKLMHTFDNKWSGAWYIAEEEYEFDDDFTQYGETLLPYSFSRTHPLNTPLPHLYHTTTTSLTPPSPQVDVLSRRPSPAEPSPTSSSIYKKVRGTTLTALHCTVLHCTAL